MTDRELMQQVYQYLTGESVRHKTTDKHIAELISEGLAQPEQEPVADTESDVLTATYMLGLHAGKKATNRQPLTDDEIIMLSQSAGVYIKVNDDCDLLFARAIERAHGIGSEE